MITLISLIWWSLNIQMMYSLYFSFVLRFILITNRIGSVEKMNSKERTPKQSKKNKIPKKSGEDTPQN